MRCSTFAGSVDERFEDLTLPPIRSLPIWGIGNFHDNDQFMDNAGAITSHQNISPQRVLVNPSSPGTQVFNNSRTAAPQSSPDSLDMLFVQGKFEGRKGFVCTYKCPRSGDTCGAILSGRDRRNRYRHAATHAQAEEEIVSCGVIAMEDALALTQLSKVVVKCKIEGCDFEKKVWRTDHVRERHEMKVHPEVYTQRVRGKKKAKKGCD